MWLTLSSIGSRWLGELRTGHDFLLGHSQCQTTTGSSFRTQLVFLATGAGAFTPVKLRTEGINNFEGTQVHYTEIPHTQLLDKSVVIIGDSQAAVDCVIDATKYASNIIFLHRKRRLDATENSLAKLSALAANHSIQQIKGKITGYSSDTRLEQIHIQQGPELTSTHSTDVVLVRQGNSPKQSDIDSWGLETAARQVPVDTANFETSISGIYAVGDINSYPVKRKLILCGIHEATLAAFAATAKLRPEKPVHLQYTTTSTELLQRLGVTNTSQG